MPGCNKVDSNGTITYMGTSDITKGNHNNMPQRTEAYLETDERGHIQASSLGGSNKTENVVPQSAELNHGAYYSMEKGERAALINGAAIQSEKIAYVSNQPGGRPDAFIVNDTVSYGDGQTQNIHLSFSNLTNAEQSGINAESVAQVSDMYSELPNPGDNLREVMPSEEYAQLMEETDALLPNVGDFYTEHIEIDMSESSGVWEYNASSEAVTDTDAECVFAVSNDVGDNGPSVDDAGADASVDDI